MFLKWPEVCVCPGASSNSTCYFEVRLMGMNRAYVPHNTLQVGISKPLTNCARKSHCSLGQKSMQWSQFLPQIWPAVQTLIGPVQRQIKISSLYKLAVHKAIFCPTLRHCWEWLENTLSAEMTEEGWSGTWGQHCLVGDPVVGNFSCPVVHLSTRHSLLLFKACGGNYHMYHKAVIIMQWASVRWGLMSTLITRKYTYFRKNRVKSESNRVHKSLGIRPIPIVRFP